jgi:gas vesicle protein
VKEVIMKEILHSDTQGRAGAFVVGLLCGAAVGTAVGLLAAPKPGHETRRQMSDSASRLRRKASEAYDGAFGAVTDAMSRGRHALDVGKEAYQKARPGNGSASDVALP